LSESDCYLRCYGERTGTVDVVNAARRQHDRPAPRLQIDPKLIPDDVSEEHQGVRPAEAA